MKNFKKLFLITSILLLTFSLNGLVFATNNCNNYNFDKDKYLTRLNNVLNKVKTGNTSAKMQTLLSRLKTKYSNYPSIKGMIGYLNYNIDNSFVCITNNTTTDTETITHSTGAIVDNDTTNTEAGIVTTNKCSDTNKVDQSKYFSIYNSKATGGQVSWGQNDILPTERLYFKDEMNPHSNFFKYFSKQGSLSVPLGHIGIPFKYGEKTITVENVSIKMKTMKFKYFVPPGIYVASLSYHFSEDLAYMKCDTNLMKMKYWVGPVKPEEPVSWQNFAKEKMAKFWKGELTVVETGNSSMWSAGNVSLYPPKPDWSGWVYFEVEFPDMECCNGNGDALTYSYPSFTPSIHFKNIENFKKYYVPWYDSIDKEDKWEDSDPPSDCTEGKIFGTWNK